MSHAIGAVRFNSDGKIMYCEYNGTSDVMIPKLYETNEDVSDNWRNHPWPNDGECQHELEDVEIFSTYGGGFYWPGKACRKCNFIIKNLQPDSSWDEDVYAWHHEALPDGFEKWYSTDGYPEWSPWKHWKER